MRRRRCRGLLYERKRRQRRWCTNGTHSSATSRRASETIRANNVRTADSRRVHGVYGSIERNRVTMLFPLLAYNHMHFSNWIIIYHYYYTFLFTFSEHFVVVASDTHTHIVGEALRLFFYEFISLGRYCCSAFVCVYLFMTTMTSRRQRNTRNRKPNTTHFYFVRFGCRLYCGWNVKCPKFMAVFA